MNYNSSCTALGLGMFPNKSEIRQAFKDLSFMYCSRTFRNKQPIFAMKRMKEITSAQRYLCDLVLACMSETARIVDSPFRLGLHVNLPPPVERRPVPMTIQILQEGGMLSVAAPAITESCRGAKPNTSEWIVIVPPGTVPGTVLLASETGLSSTKRSAESWMAVTVLLLYTADLYLRGLDICQNIRVNPEDLKNVKRFKVEGTNGQMLDIECPQPSSSVPFSEEAIVLYGEGLLKFRTANDKGRFIVDVLITADATRVTRCESGRDSNVYSGPKFQLFKSS